MSEPHDPQHDTPEAQAPKALRDDLKALFQPPIEVPPEVDRAVLAAAGRRLARRRHRSRPLVRWAVAAAAAAALLLGVGLLFSGLVVQVVQAVRPAEEKPAGDEYVVDLAKKELEERPRPELGPPPRQVPEHLAVAPPWQPPLPESVEPPPVPRPEGPPRPAPHPSMPVMTADLRPICRLPRYFCSVAEAPSAGGGPLPISWPGGYDEVWVIARSRATPGLRRPSRGRGALVVRRPASLEGRTLPLLGTEARAAISGCVATVEVEQTFRNPLEEAVDATYVFPLPDGASVSDFLVTIGERRIRGVVRERPQAERIYAALLERGATASLVATDRGNLFAPTLESIAARARVAVRLAYMHPLAYVDGWYEWVYPLVTERESPSRSGEDLSLAVDIAAGVPVGEVVSLHHRIDIERAGPERAVARLRPRERIANRDFVLRHRVAGRTVRAGLLAHEGERGRFFALLLYPPADAARVPRRPMDVAFVLDCSTGMADGGLRQAARAAAHALRRLGPRDRFGLYRAASGEPALGKRLVPATPANLRRAFEHLAGLRATDPATAAAGLRAALAAPRRRGVRGVVFLSNGALDDEAAALLAARARADDVQLYSVGVGEHPNPFLLERLARAGRGAVAYLDPEDGSEALELLIERIARPVMTDLSVRWGKMQAKDVYPRRIPDLLVGRPVVLTGRLVGGGPATVRIEGRVNGKRRQIEVSVDPREAGPAHRGLAHAWATARLAHLVERVVSEQATDLYERIRDLALRHRLVSPHTAFATVESREQE
ncbi:MAG: VIT domain-containing protein [Candidatus Brocadiia bacterium]